MESCLRHVMLLLGIGLVSWSTSASVLAGGSSGTEFQAYQCTSACIVNDGFSVLGSNYDSEWTGGLIFASKRGVKKSSAQMDPFHPGGTVLRWTSKYMSVAFCVGPYHFSWAGMNEKGLAFGTMRLEAIQDDPSDPRAHMQSAFWWQYVLDTCQTVEDVMATDALVTIQTVDHFLFTDRYGHSAVIEFQDGHMVFYRGDDLDISVLTNEPYVTCRDLWNRVKHTSTTYEDLNDPQRRFCIAGDRVDDFKPTTDKGAVDCMFSILKATGWNPPASMWSIVFDTKNLRIHFNTMGRRAVRVIDLLSFDLSCLDPVQMLSPHSSASGDVSEAFVEADWDVIFENARDYLQWDGTVVPEDLLRDLLNRVRRFPCTEKQHAEGVLLTSEPDYYVANPRCVAHPRTGNVFVVWNQLDRNDASYGQVNSAMLVRSLSGAYSAVELQTLSDDEGFNGSPYPTYLPREDRFLVVWDQADPASAASGSAILGRLLTNRGVPESGVQTVLTDTHRNAAPQLYLRGAGAALDVIYYSAKVSATSVSDAGLFIARLDKNYRAGTATLLMEAAAGSVDSATRADTILPTASGFVDGESIILPVEHGMTQDGGSVAYQSKVLLISAQNRVTDSEAVGQRNAVLTDLAGFKNDKNETVVLGSTLAGAAVTDHILSSGPGGLGLVRSSPQAIKAVDAGYAMMTAIGQAATGGAPSAGTEAVGLQLFASTGGKVFDRQIDGTGNSNGPFATVVRKAGGMTALTGTGMMITSRPGASFADAEAFVVVWDMKGTKGRELRAKVVQVK